MEQERATKEYVEKELPHKILMSIYKDSRASLRELGRELSISYHTVFNVRRELEGKYGICYTLWLDEKALGLAEGRLIAIKFAKQPDISVLKERFQKDVFIQDAYLASGDFDLLLYVVGLDPLDFQTWQWNLRVELSEYGPGFKFSTVNGYNLGFFPIRNEIINESEALTDTEKKILTLLNDDSKMRLSDLIEKSGTSQMRVIYCVEKLKKKGIIKSFTALTQNSSKRLYLAYGAILNPAKKHGKLSEAFSEELLKEDLHEITNDYCLMAATNGAYDSFYICTFNSGEDMLKRGAELLQSLWKEENPRIEKAMLTDIVVGRWPFHLEDYAQSPIRKQ